MIELIGHDKDNSVVYSSSDHGGFNRPVMEGSYTMRVKASGYPMKTIHNIYVENYQTTWLDIELGVYVSAPSFRLQTNKMLYPNPASDKVSVMGLPEAESIKVFDTTGRLFMEQGFSGQQTSFYIAHLPPGIYLVYIQTRESTYVNKLLKK